MEEDQRRSQILKLEFLGSLTPNLVDYVVDTFLEISEYGRFSKHAVLFTEGDQGSDAGYLLLGGEISVTKSSAPEIRCQAPELLGEMKQFNPNQERTATVEAVDELEVLRFNWYDFSAAMEQGLNESDRAAVTSALESCAWQHFTG